MVRPPHLPPIGDEEAKRKWRLMNRPSISQQHLHPKRSVNTNNNCMPIYDNSHTNNKQSTNSNRRSTNNHNNNDYQELGPIIIYIVLAVIILTLLIFLWWIIIPIAIIAAIYMITKKN